MSHLKGHNIYFPEKKMVAFMERNTTINKKLIVRYFKTTLCFEFHEFPLKYENTHPEN